jgi:hypothetical protein
MDEPKLLKVALFEYPRLNSSSWVYDEDASKYTEMVRVSEWVEVSFEPLHPAVVVPAKVTAIEKEIDELEVKHYQKIKKLREDQQSLMALTYTAPEAPMPGDNLLDNSRIWG